MSTRQPVSRAASRAFWPSRPIASDSWSSGTITVACLPASSTSTSRTRAGDSAFATNRGHDHPHALASRPHAGADRVDAVDVRDHGDLRAVARLTGDAGDLNQA